MKAFYRRASDRALPATLRVVNVHLLYNPLSGSGRARTLAERFTHALNHAGIAVITHPTHQSDGTASPPIDPATLKDSLLAVIGGDGTVHRAAPIAAKAGAALYHIPAGTENLFARHYGMTADPADLIRALRAPCLIPMDLATCNGQPFVLMASFGPDASVIHRLHNSRQGPIRHWSYLRPILREIIEPNIPKLTVHVDNTPWLDAQRGLLVIANSPHYALGLNPARAALADDGLLDAAFYPCDTIADAAMWAARLFFDRINLPHGAIESRGHSFEVNAGDDHSFVQMDGEATSPELAANGLLYHNRYDVLTYFHAIMVLAPIINKS